jgi:hypothetical protein
VCAVEVARLATSLTDIAMHVLCSRVRLSKCVLIIFSVLPAVPISMLSDLATETQMPIVRLSE